MIATWFEWRIKSGRDEEFRAVWAEVTHALHSRGSRGSTLFRRSEDHYCALARWPDRATLDAAFAAEATSEASERLRHLISATMQQVELDEVDNQWRD
ncbi:MAG: antibiotic biosynthesis monooxygenase [Pseudomonadota bacterium]|nr:antibiotic biosynthesis monooxygenase [Pseudomonadota bacterium]